MVGRDAAEGNVEWNPRVQSEDCPVEVIDVDRAIARVASACEAFGRR